MRSSRSRNQADLPERYLCRAIAGRGAFSEVFRVRDRVLGRDLALKRFRARIHRDLEGMLADEFVLLSQFSHPNLPRVFDFGVDGRGRPFFTMEYLGGPSFADFAAGGRRARGRPSRGSAARTAGGGASSARITPAPAWTSSPAQRRASFLGRSAARALSALACIHARGVVHGDVKPSNVLFADGGRARLPLDSGLKLVDFGLGGALAHIAGQSARGTPRYMAPEVAAGGVPDQAGDLFSLGTVLLEMLACLGLQAPSAPVVARHLDAFARRLGARQRGFRYRSADEAYGDILAVLEEDTDRSTRDLRRLFVFSARPRSWAPPLAEAASRIEEARSGRGGAIFLAGVAGGSAERILTEIRARALAAGMGVVLVPVAPDDADDAIAEGLGLAAATILANRGPGPPDRPDGRSAARAGLGARLEESSRRMSPQGTVFILQGAERLPAGKFGVLSHLSLALRKSGALVVAAGIGEGQEEGGGDLAPPDLIRFPALQREGLEEVLTRAFGVIQPLGGLVRALEEATAGDLEAVGSLLEQLVRTGALARGRGGWVADLSAVRDSVPRAADVRRHMPALPPPLARHARLLALLGPSFGEGLASAATGLRGGALLRTLARLRAAGYIRAASGDRAEPAWRFSHPGLRTALAGEIRPAVRRDLHRRALRWLDAARGSGALSTRAWHLDGAGDREGAARAYLSSGIERGSRHDLSGACADLERAAALVPASRADLAAEIRMRLAGALQEAGHAEKSLALLDAFLGSDLDRLPDETRREDLLWLQARNLEMLGRMEESGALLRDALKGVPEEDALRRSRILRALGWIAVLSGDLDRAEALERDARREAGRAADPAALASARSLRGQILRGRGALAEAQAEFQEAIDLYRNAGDDAMAASDLQNLAILWIRKDPSRARALFAKAEEECSRIGLDNVLTSVLMNLAIVEKTTGEWDAAERRYRSAIDVGERIGARGLHRAYMNLGTLLTDRGAFEEAEACFERAARRVSGARGTLPALFVDLNRARLRLRQRRPEEALDLLERLAAGLSPKHPQTWINLHDYRAEALATLGRAEEASRAADTAHVAAMGQEDETLRGEALLYRAEVDRLAGKRESALRALDGAERIFRENGQTFYAARARLERAEVLALDPGSARQAVDEAAAAQGVFERLGAAPFLDKAQRLAMRMDEAVRRSLDAPRELRTLYTISRLVATEGDLPALLRGILEAAIGLLSAERGLVYLLSGERNEDLVKAASIGLDPQEEADILRISRGILKRALRDEAPLLSGDATSDARFRSLKSVIRFQIHSFICAALKTGARLVGTIYVDHPATTRFSERDAEFMRALAAFASPAILSARRRARLDDEVAGLRDEVRTLRRGGMAAYSVAALIGDSPAMREVKSLVERCAGTQSTALITGETGTGKDLVARVIHFSGARAAGPFVAVNSASLEGGLVDSDLFGIVKGAATDVVSRPGRFEQADGGTLFLDEVDALPSGTQAKMLRLLEDGYVERVGSVGRTPVDVRLIAATSADLQQLTGAGSFRKDLYYRLNVVGVRLPPLRRRREDIGPLLTHFIAEVCAERGRPPLKISPAVLRGYEEFDWPGNVRQLRNCVERAVTRSGADALPPVHETTDADLGRDGAALASRAAAEFQSLRSVAAAYARLVHRRVGGRMDLACKALGVNYRTLRKHLAFKPDPGA